MTTQAHAGAVLFAKDMQRVAAFYQAVTGLDIRNVDSDFIKLDSTSFQLIVHRIPAHIADKIHIDRPPRPRENTSIKLTFYVPSIAAARSAASLFHGALKGPELEWDFEGDRICDGHDPEGNVFQLRQPTSP